MISFQYRLSTDHYKMYPVLWLLKTSMTQQQLPLTGLIVGRVSPNVLVCGDPERADQVASLLLEVERLSDQREYRAYRGMYGKTAVTVCSHGIGAPGAAIAFEELIAAGASRIIRVGTCGALQPNIESGDLVESMESYDPHRSVVLEGVTAGIQIALECLERLEIGI